MISYFWLTVLTIFGALALCAALAFTDEAKRVLVGGGAAGALPLPFFCLLISFACLYPIALYIFNSPATVDEISSLIRTCSGAKELIESKTELVRHRDVIAIYNQCLAPQI